MGRRAPRHSAWLAGRVLLRPHPCWDARGVGVAAALCRVCVLSSQQDVVLGVSAARATAMHVMGTGLGWVCNKVVAAMRSAAV